MSVQSLYLLKILSLSITGGSLPKVLSQFVLHSSVILEKVVTTVVTVVVVVEELKFLTKNKIIKF